MIRYWLTAPTDPKREEVIRTICRVYHEAPSLRKQGERTVSTDELTGVQALERKHPGFPLAPGHVQRREFEYERHGTCCFILSRDVVTFISALYLSCRLFIPSTKRWASKLRYSYKLSKGFFNRLGRFLTHFVDVSIKSAIFALFSVPIENVSEDEGSQGRSSGRL